ncbi:MAG TPA: hypothetical protein G4N93_01235 [Dehalococcoidia bacterium]|nr:hypothetical protein [Dehalococcoidia bacterium]
MRGSKIFRILVSGIILVLLVVAFPAIPIHATGENITIDPDEGEIGDNIEILGYDFDANYRVYIYFSSYKADVGDNIDGLDAYEEVERAFTTVDGTFNTNFVVPYTLTDGYHTEDVHGGYYYVYITYRNSVRIEATAKFSIIKGEIELDPEKGLVGSEVTISGEELRQGQIITIEYDYDVVDIVSGDKATDSEGKFNCTIIVPESITGNHTITVTDESGNKPEAEFIVKPKITVSPTSSSGGNTVEVSGAGFAKKEYITVTFDGNRVSTNPIAIKTNHKGSFTGSFLVPSNTTSGISEVRARDRSANKANVDLTISAGISLSPTTSQTLPGYVGIELTIYGSGFINNTLVTITYSNSEVITVAKAPTDVYGNFLATFTVPPSVAGNHLVTATDVTNTVISIFTMEAQAPPIPVPRLPKVAGMSNAEAYFDWEDVEDASGVTYALQVATDADFAIIVLEKKGLTHSEHTIAKEERLEPTKKKTPYYWRVKAVDSASNESDWTHPVLFYVGSSWTSVSSWPIYIWIGLGVVLLTILGFWLRRRLTQHRDIG